jgi:undecaprenyl diphosphate synthase
MNERVNVPQCIGFIMDGNRRWAKERGMQGHEGHVHGAQTLETTIRLLRDRDIPHAVFYAFSTENWKRSEAELAVFRELLEKELTKLHRQLNEADESNKKVRFRFIGDITQFGNTLVEKIHAIEEESSTFTDTTIWIALSYGGRAEIVRAVNAAVQAHESIDEGSFGQYLWTHGMPDPDIIIRTGGEQRLSNFLPWQSVYSELFFTNTYWPDFGESELESILEEYGTRQRRRGA